MFNCWCTWLDIKFTEPVLISEPFRIGSDRFILNQPPVLSGSSHHSCPDPAVTFLVRIQSPFLSGSNHLSVPDPVTFLVRIQSTFWSGSSHLFGPDPVTFLVRIRSPFWSGFGADECFYSFKKILQNSFISETELICQNILFAFFWEFFCVWK